MKKPKIRTDCDDSPAQAANNLGHNRPDFSRVLVDKIEHVPPDLLKPAARRLRKHTKEKMAKLKASVANFGFVSPILIDETDTILAGHARWEAAKEMGLPRIPVIRVEHLNSDEKRVFAIAENRLGELADWDNDVLAIEFQELLEIDFHFDLDVSGFDTPQIDVIIADSDAESGEPDPADVLPEVIGAPVTQPGDEWVVSRSRFICGDSLEKATYEKLLGDKKARAIVSDPPFNVKISGHVSGLGKAQHREFAMAAGEMSKPQFTEFNQTWMSLAAGTAMPGALVYVYMDWRHTSELLAAAEGANLRAINMAVWDKMSGAMGSFYRSQHELCWIYKIDDNPHVNNVELGRHGRYRTNCWKFRGMSSFGRGRDEALAAHPTVKPWAMIAEIIKDCSNRGDIILDPFLGSGSTLIAAEKTGRACYGIEIDPRYCDVAVKRWEKMTCKQAIHAESGKTFAEIAAERLANSEEVRHV